MANTVKVTLDELAPYIPIVDRIHGPAHPEFHEVRDIFNKLVEITDAAGEECPELKEEFAQLRKVTNNYEVPCDVCESFEEVYQKLEKLDKTYSGCPSRG